MFPEIDYDRVDEVRGMDISSSRRQDRREAQALLEGIRDAVRQTDADGDGGEVNGEDERSRAQQEAREDGEAFAAHVGNG